MIDGDHQGRVVSGEVGRPASNRPPSTPNRRASASSSQSPGCWRSFAHGLGWSDMSSARRVFTAALDALPGRRVGRRDRVDDHPVLDAVLTRGEELVVDLDLPRFAVETGPVARRRHDTPPPGPCRSCGREWESGYCRAGRSLERAVSRRDRSPSGRIGVAQTSRPPTVLVAAADGVVDRGGSRDDLTVCRRTWGRPARPSPPRPS